MIFIFMNVVYTKIFNLKKNNENMLLTGVQKNQYLALESNDIVNYINKNIEKAIIDMKLYPKDTLRICAH